MSVLKFFWIPETYTCASNLRRDTDVSKFSLHKYFLSDVLYANESNVDGKGCKIHRENFTRRGQFFYTLVELFFFTNEPFLGAFHIVFRRKNLFFFHFQKTSFNFSMVGVCLKEIQ